MLTRTMQGTLAPADDEAFEVIKKMKAGAIVRCDIRQMRNWKYHKKWFVLAKFAFDIWEETMEPVEYRGQPVRPAFDKFRKDLTILAGYWHPVFNIDGTFKVEADSISWASMDEETFERMYSKTIDAILAKVLPRHGLDRRTIDAHVDRVLEFA